MKKSELKQIIREEIRFVRRINEASKAAEQAKKRGLQYAGFGRWKDPKSGRVTHKTMDGKLVKVDNVDKHGNVDRKAAKDYAKAYWSDTQKKDKYREDAVTIKRALTTAVDKYEKQLERSLARREKMTARGVRFKKGESPASQRRKNEKEVAQDRKNLTKIVSLVKKGDYKKASHILDSFDSVMVDKIPISIQDKLEAAR